MPEGQWEISILGLGMLKGLTVTFQTKPHVYSMGNVLGTTSRDGGKALPLILANLGDNSQKTVRKYTVYYII